MEIRFVKMNPAGNVTVFVESAVAEADQPAVACALMARGGLGAEQVGFVNGQTLRMAGGEFCGNATRALAVLRAFDDGAFSGHGRYEVVVSGYDAPLDVEVRRDGPTVFHAAITMPAPLSELSMCLSTAGGGVECWCVDFGGIIHFVVEAPPAENLIEAARRSLRRDWEAFGVMFCDADDHMTPYVEVRGVSGVWEGSCASGSTAVACRRRRSTACGRAALIQPGGILEVAWDDTGVLLDGPVYVVARGIAFLSGVAVGTLK